MQSLMGETPKTALHRYYLLPITYYLLPITLVQMFCISDMLPCSLLRSPCSLKTINLYLTSRRIAISKTQVTLSFKS
ncbi:hypothetical protein [Moorena producens]|uniref:hypothetical protein n=1 Tax=Moorena producens TaxID=1155739 RepID=UPI0011EA608E|nr:hypothetical protein [Moorena producens]